MLRERKILIFLAKIRRMSEMTNFIASPIQVTVPVNGSTSGIDGSQDLEAFDIKARLNSV